MARRGKQGMERKEVDMENAEHLLFGIDLFGDTIKPKSSGVLAEKFTMPPFTILDARSGFWQERKRSWLSCGLASELGRKKDLLRMSKNITETKKVLNSSVFDPVLAELAYRWFSPKGGQIVDPFAGGSVRGIVAGALGRSYWGCDLRPEQVAANEMQLDTIATAVRPIWVCGDSMETLRESPEADMVLSCPPYGDLEKYSDDPRDLSTMDWHAFVAAYKRIILRTVSRMKSDTFACWVVGDFRDKRGFYRNFVSITIDAFEQCNAQLYNEAILATSCVTAGMRAGLQFKRSRKLTKVHQNVLVFCKGDWRKAVAKCGDIGYD